MPKSDWEKKIEKRTANLGFISRINAFREPSDAEKASALAIETKSWQETKGKKPYTLGMDYSTSVYKSIGHYGQNIKATRADGQKAEHRKEAIEAYIETPIDIGKEVWLIMDWWTAFRHFLKGNKIKQGE